MSSRSTPKRVLEVMDDGARSDSDASQLKRVRIGDSLVSGYSSESGTGTPCESFNLGILHDAMDIDDDGPRNGVLPYPQDSRLLMPPVHRPKLFAQDPFQSQVPQPREIEHEDRRDPRPSDASAVVCFGMLRDIKIRIDPVEDPQALRFDHIRDENGIFASLGLSIEDNRCDILCHDTYIATMNTKTQFALSSIRLGEQPTWTGVVPMQELQEKMMAAAESTSKGPSRITCTMGILVSGPRSIAQDLAKQLARQHLFLQNPVPIPPNLEYNNPQFLYLVGTPCPDRPILAPLLGIGTQREAATPGTIEDEEEECDSIRAVLDNFPQREFRRDIEIDSRIRATLESHQREAVEFIISREQTHSSDRGKLWHFEGWNKGHPVYKHIITGALSPEPTDFCGGLLADDMGVGKTLSMIAGIVAGLGCNKPTSTDDELNTKSGNPDPIRVPSTLVIVPRALLLDGWIAEVEKHVLPGTLKCYKYHGPGRSISLSSPPAYDIILSTYATVVADFSNKGRESVLHKIHWHRVVLDEAHAVRNSSTKQFEAVNSLSASIRWCMTGTPIQNSVEDLASLVQFLRVPQLDSTAGFRKYILTRAKGSSRFRQPDERMLKPLLTAICLRRKMSTVFPALGGIPVRHTPRFSDEERRTYDELMQVYKRHRNAAVNKQGMGRRGNTILMRLLVRLRVFCNTGLRSAFLGEKNFVLDPDERITMLQQSGQNICSVCNTEIFLLDGSECFDSQENSLLRARALKCEECARPISDTDPQADAGDTQNDATLISDGAMEDIKIATAERQKLAGDITQTTQYSSKLDALLQDIQQHINEDKSIVFSCWKRSLDLVGQMFDENGIVFCRVDGDAREKRRHAVLELFQRDNAVRVLLITIGTGAEGLNNLSVASRIHILEPQWNPSVEKQAIGRALRWGQGKNVFVVRYIMQETVEQDVKKRQKLKKGLSLKDREVR